MLVVRYEGDGFGSRPSRRGGGGVSGIPQVALGLRRHVLGVIFSYAIRERPIGLNGGCCQGIKSSSCRDWDKARTRGFDVVGIELNATMATRARTTLGMNFRLNFDVARSVEPV